MRERRASPAARVFAIAALVFAALPLVSLIIWTLIPRWPLSEAFPQTFTLASWKLVTPAVLRSLGANAAYSVVVAAASCAIALTSARALLRCPPSAAAFFEALFFFPALVPVLCVILAAHRWALAVFSGSLSPVTALVYLFFSFPYAFRVLYPAYRSEVAPLRETAFSLGAPPPYVFVRVELPVLAPHLAVAFVFSYAVAYGQYLIDAFFRPPSAAPFSTQMAQFLQSPNRNAAAVYTLLYTVCGVLVLIPIGRLGHGRH